MTVKEVYLSCELNMVEVSGGGYNPHGDFVLGGKPLVSLLSIHYICCDTIVPLTNSECTTTALRAMPMQFMIRPLCN